MIYQDSKTLLDVRGLRATVNGIEILKGIDLTVKSGEVHAIMGPNGSGKSTFAKVLAGHPAYEVTGGTVVFQGKSLFDLKPEERARAGLFLGAAAEGGVDLEDEFALGLQAGVNVGGLGGAADEERGRGEEREGKRDLRDDERVARQPAPAPARGVLAGMFLEIQEHVAAGQFEGRHQAERHGADHAEDQGGPEEHGTRTGLEDQVER